MKYNFDEVIDRRNTYSLKWGTPSLIKGMGLTDIFDDNTLPLFTADMDFVCPQPVVDALHRVVDNRIYGYTAPHDVPEYYDAIIRWFRDKRGWSIEKEEIIYCPGTVTATSKCVEAFTEPGDKVLITRPVYGPFTSSIEKNSREVLSSQLINTDGYYTIDFADFEEKAADPTCKLFILCNPHNPVGRIWSDDELKKMADICKRNGVLIVADEIHGDLIRKGQVFRPIASLVDNKGIITLTAINKTFNTAGLHCTNVVIKDPDLRKTFSDTLGWSMPTPFAVAALIAAYTEGDEWLEQVNDYIDDNLRFAIDFLAKRMPKVKVRMPEGTYVLWMDFSAYDMDEKERWDMIYNKANVLLEPGSMFDPDHGSGFERICTPTRRALLKEAMERIAKEFEGR